MSLGPSAGPVRRGHVLATLAVAVALGTMGCGPWATFSSTDTSFVPHEALSRPEVFIDRKPEGAYLSVGIIEVHGRWDTEIGLMMRAAADKGQEIGCDLIVDMTLHRSSGGTIPDRRWVVGLATEPPLRRRVSDGAVGARAPWKPTIHAASTHVQPAPVIYTYPYPVAQRRREFVCGIYTMAPPRVAAHPKPGAAADDPIAAAAHALWSKLASGSDAPCGTLHAVLARDAECEGEQCVAAMIVSQEFLGRCDEGDAAQLEQIDALNGRWTKQVGKKARPTCLKALKRAVTSDVAARSYASVCIQDREPSAVELEALGDAVRPSAAGAGAP